MRLNIVSSIKLEEIFFKYEPKQTYCVAYNCYAFLQWYIGVEA